MYIPRLNADVGCLGHVFTADYFVRGMTTLPKAHMLSSSAVDNLPTPGISLSAQGLLANGSSALSSPEVSLSPESSPANGSWELANGSWSLEKGSGMLAS